MLTLLDTDEDGVNIEDNQGRTPMQVLKFTASHQDENEMFLLHHLAATSDSLTEKSMLSLEVLMLFISSYREAVKCF